MFFGVFEIEHMAILAEDEGFEPAVGCPTHAFQACALGRYANPPALRREPQRPKGSGVQRQLRHIR